VGCQPVCIELIERKLCARSPTERLQDKGPVERMGSRPSAAGGGGAPAPALRPSRSQVYVKNTVAPGDRACLPPSSTDYNVVPKPVGADANIRDLDGSVGASGHTTSPYATTSLVRVLSTAHGFKEPALAIPSHAKRCRVHRIPPRVRDDRDTPLCGTRQREF